MPRSSRFAVFAAEQDRVAIELAAGHDEPGQRIQRIVLEEGDDPSRLDDAEHLGEEPLPVRRRNMVQHADGKAMSKLAVAEKAGRSRRTRRNWTPGAFRFASRMDSAAMSTPQSFRKWGARKRSINPTPQPTSSTASSEVRPKCRRAISTRCRAFTSEEEVVLAAREGQGFTDVAGVAFGVFVEIQFGQRRERSSNRWAIGAVQEASGRSEDGTAGDGLFIDPADVRAPGRKTAIPEARPRAKR